MSTKPEAGQWWETEFGRIYAVGPMDDGTAIIVHNEAGFIWTVSPEKFEAWTHVVNCEGWDWVVPEQPQPVEDPDEWVIQDRVPVRTSCDQVMWIKDGKSVTGFAYSFRNSASDGRMHGYTESSGYQLHVRCRRRDLPKVEHADEDPVMNAIAYSIQAQERNEAIKPQPQKTDDGTDWSYHNQQKPQPRKTMLRLWIDSDCNIHAGLKGDRDLELLYDHETRQFYTEEPS